MFQAKPPTRQTTINSHFPIQNNKRHIKQGVKEVLVESMQKINKDMSLLAVQNQNDNHVLRSSSRANKMLTGSPYHVKGQDIRPTVRQVVDQEKKQACNTSRISSATTSTPKDAKHSKDHFTTPLCGKRTANISIGK